MTVCPTPLKIAHPSKAAAARQAHAQAVKNQEGRTPRSLIAYRCSCGSWHTATKVHRAAPKRKAREPKDRRRL